MKIAVVMGGITSEREVSLRSGQAILNSLLRQGYDAYKIDLTKDNLVSAFIENEYDLVYLALHGEYGEDGRVQSVLDMLGKKYTGSGVTGSAVAMDKILTKIIAKDLGIRIAKTYEAVEYIDSYPVVIKPAKEGSSVGLYICNTEEEARKAYEILKEKEPLIEEFIKGEELTAGVLNGEKLGVVRIKPKSGLYDYESKYTVGMTEYECPAQIDKNAYEEASEAARKIHEKLGLKGVTRSDFILKDGKTYFLEVNTCPGMTETSLAPKLATLKGYSFDDLTRIIVESC
ncbi:D-alanine--D-alanine ligase [Cetobacterium somerae]|uniref:D-alanine--D-alanine ligase n=1 Tax=Cetobacterium sp. NK01 TaxID=2993530 RepID=UPI002116658E|nr:D-alanine--D-alanine ligase [Cetobacterium sp. NK01]MCQ8212328.1 D-alanine--D-alanine ligase [Cetobacterium sp. NK01]